MYGNSNMNQSGNFVNAASNPYVQNQFVQNQQQQQMMPSGGGGYGGGHGGGGIVRHFLSYFSLLQLMD